MTIDQFVATVKTLPYSKRRAAWRSLQVRVSQDIHGLVAYPDVLQLVTADHLRAALAEIGLEPDTPALDLGDIDPEVLRDFVGRAAQVGEDTAPAESPSIVVPDWADAVVVEADHLGVRVEVRWDGDPAGDVDPRAASAFADTYQQAYDSAIAQAIAEMATSTG